MSNLLPDGHEKLESKIDGRSSAAGQAAKKETEMGRFLLFSPISTAILIAFGLRVNACAVENRVLVRVHRVKLSHTKNFQIIHQVSFACSNAVKSSKSSQICADMQKLYYFMSYPAALLHFRKSRYAIVQKSNKALQYTSNSHKT